MKKVLYFILVLVILFIGCTSEKKKWEKAKASNSMESYNKFIDNYPKSEFYKLAINAIDSINYKQTDSVCTLAAYKKFINDFPDSRYIESAKKKLRKVSFTLFQYQEPFANEEIAIFPVVNGRVGTDELGFGKTDKNGNVTIEFFNPREYTEFVLIGRIEGSYMLIRHNGYALTFKCDDYNSTCDLRKLIFETFEMRMH